MKKFCLYFLLLVCLFFLVGTHSTVIAAVNRFDTSFGVASYIPLKDKNAKDGAIVSYTKQGYLVTKTSYDPTMIGIISENPAVAFVIEGEGNIPMLSTGNVIVSVSSINGVIRKGDPITSSEIAGVGMKATRSGYVVGSALDNYTEKDTKKIGKISIAMNIHFLGLQVQPGNSLLNILNLSALSVYEQPTVVFRYFLSGLILLISIAFGFVSFGRIAGRGIEAMGRNPLASKMIQVGIFLNVLITIAIILAGLTISFFVLRL